MIKYENECCDCANNTYPCYPCQCGKTKVPHVYCDDCDDDGDIYYFEGHHLCEDCIRNKLDADVKLSNLRLVDPYEDKN